MALPCIVEGTLPLSIAWLLDGVDIQDLKLPGVTIEEDTELRENNITLVKVRLHAKLLFYVFAVIIVQDTFQITVPSSSRNHKIFIFLY